ncbi:hypothetical protein SAY87_006106 [Trapa incisa]|uniref:Uncharacterized protein n=1 Tax=Trapa incisa TaxID=236973 RepID=A0AAN7KB09_9MYRT|nr:hypothetical protein SAY87_006106 [Trapa incisa]
MTVWMLSSLDYIVIMEQIEARDLYWEVICGQAAESNMNKVENLLLRCIERNPFGRFKEAEREASRGLRLLLEWGSPWDKRIPWDGWVSWARVLRMKAKEKAWPKEAWSLFRLGVLRPKTTA